MPFKKARFGPRLAAAARSGAHYRDVHVFIGGTGAVGGAAVLQMIAMYEEMMAIQPAAAPGDVPVLIVTGRGDEDINAFVTRLNRFIRTRWGASHAPRQFEHGYLTPGGVYVAISPFQLKPIPGLELVTDADPAHRDEKIGEFLRLAGADRESPKEKIAEALMNHVRATRPLSAFLEDRLVRLRDYGPKPFRSVLLGFPLPSILAYQQTGLTHVANGVGLADDFIGKLRHEFEEAFAQDLASVTDHWGTRVLVAHTTGVGGMYDEALDGTTTPRLGFAHAARDQFLRTKHEEAEHLTREYAKRGILMLVTAAAIGIDEVRVRERIPLHNEIVRKLRDLPDDVFPAARTRKRQYLRRVHPKTLALTGDAPAKPRDLFFRTGDELAPEYAIRSGENGFFSPANADALYRVMKIASASELGHVLASVALLGDDPNVPWFANGICYYTETANSKQVFDFLYQPPLLGYQLNAVDPLALQDLGSAKHQAELHTLALLILLHRLKTADFDGLPPYPSTSFDARQYFLESSRPLTFRDVETWDCETLADELKTLVTARRAEQLLPLRPMRDPGQFAGRDEAHTAILEVVLQSVFAIPSLGSPIVVEDEGQPVARTGYWIAPLGEVVTDDDSLRRIFAAGAERAGCSVEEYAAFEMAVNGFIDLRPVGIISSVKTAGELRPGALTITRNAEAFANALHALEPYSFFATCGLVAVLHRLRALGLMLREARTDLGTMQDWIWSVPRDERGHTLVVPGVVEALRMIAEGQEKTTGTEYLDGIWGYERRLPVSRASEIVAEVFRRRGSGTLVP
ncbi:MAG TPA: hypothetical protein VGF48_04735 [Thermoanaerobaculia bacterium]|jgi:hypothetical protein